MVIGQGDVFWAALRSPVGSEPGYRRPVIVVQSDKFNSTAIRTVVVCTITSNLDRAAAPGNVGLAGGEANLPGRSVADVTQIATVDRAVLREKIGTLSRARLAEVLAGIALVLSAD